MSDIQLEKTEAILPWYKHPEIKESLVTIPSYKIILREKIHRQSEVSLHLGKRFKNTVAVREGKRGYYILVAGLNSYLRAKAFNMPIQAHVTQLTRQEFKEKYNLEQ